MNDDNKKIMTLGMGLVGISLLSLHGICSCHHRLGF